MRGSANILLITGVPGIGKTTVIRKVAASLPGVKISGFYSEEIRVNNARQGFELVTFQGQRFVMAHVDLASVYRVGRYGVTVAVIDIAIENALPEERSTKLFIIDEIGKMECFSSLFVKRMTSILDSGKPVIATIALKGGGFIAEVKNRPGIELWEMTTKNRDLMAQKIIDWFESKKS
jgi:nucleoside-triphosphatase